MPDVRCAFGLVGSERGRRHSHHRSRGFLRSGVPFCKPGTSPVSSGPLSPAPSRVSRGPQDHRYRQRSSAPGPVRATRRPSLVLQRSLFSRREGASPLRSRGGHHSSRRNALRQPGKAPAQPASRRPAMPSPTASRFTAALSSANHSHPRGLPAFVAPRHLPVPARTPTSTVAPNPGMQRTRYARR